jgi:hypothetical protein
LKAAGSNLAIVVSIVRLACLDKRSDDAIDERML